VREKKYLKEVQKLHSVVSHGRIVVSGLKDNQVKDDRGAVGEHRVVVLEKFHKCQKISSCYRWVCRITLIFFS
jgi:hypothetical protein